MANFITRSRFDIHMALVMIAYLGVFAGAYVAAGGSPETAIIRGFGSLAFLMLSFTLLIGPLSRFSPLFKRLVYNRRHLGVTTFFVGLIHAAFALIQFFEGDLLGIFSTNSDFISLARFPFVPFGFGALLILGVMAATSHDWWFHKLGIVRWKSIHMMVYVAYTLLVIHVAFGFLQDQNDPLYWAFFTSIVVTVFGAHMASARLERMRDHDVGATEDDGFVYACELAQIEEGRARPVSLGDERVAIIKHEGRAYAMTNVCPHQNGPLGEGRVCDGYLECPWHGYQFNPATGKGPPGYADRVPIYEIREQEGSVFVKPGAFYWDDRHPEASENQEGGAA